MLHTPPVSNTKKNVKFWKPWSSYTISNILPNNTVTIKATPHAKPVKINVSRIKHYIQNKHSRPHEEISKPNPVIHDNQSDLLQQQQEHDQNVTLHLKITGPHPSSSPRPTRYFKSRHNQASLIIEIDTPAHIANLLEDTQTNEGHVATKNNANPV